MAETNPLNQLPENRFFADLAYGEHERQKLDLSIPVRPVTESGAILMIHGGGWVSCDKSAHIEDVKYWSSKGFIAATMNYRYASAACHIPDMLEDISAAIGLIKSKCGDIRFNLTKVLLSGGSAGAHLCLMYAYTMADNAPLRPAAVAVCCPPVDLTPKDILISKKPELESWRNEILSYCAGVEITSENIGTPETKKALSSVSPVRYITPGTTPTLVAHGNEDDIVPFSQCEELHKKLLENGVHSDFVMYRRTGHDMKGDSEAEERYKELFLQYALRYLV